LKPFDPEIAFEKIPNRRRRSRPVKQRADATVHRGGCTSGKIHFKTIKQARSRAADYTKIAGRVLQSYKCRECGDFHLFSVK
jgi:hypothetical protein